MIIKYNMYRKIQNLLQIFNYLFLIIFFDKYKLFFQNNHYMGNKSQIPAIPTFKQTDWQEISLQDYNQQQQLGYFHTFQNNYTYQLADEYEVFFQNQRQYEYYINTFKWRLKEAHIVKSLYLNQDHKQQFCSRTYCAKVYIQHIKTRLSDITDIPFPQNLYVVESMLNGYEKLWNNVNYFRVEENQVCVDQNGHVRVWMNADLSKHIPQPDSEQTDYTEQTMVEQIIYIVNANTDKSQQPEQNLFDFIYSRSQRPKFQDAKTLVKQYARKYGVAIPDYFQSVVQIFEKRNQEGYQQQQQQEQQQQYDKEEDNETHMNALGQENLQHKIPAHQNRVTYEPQQHFIQQSKQYAYPIQSQYGPPVMAYPHHSYPKPIINHMAYGNPLGYLPRYQVVNKPTIQLTIPKPAPITENNFIHPHHYQQIPVMPIQPRMIAPKRPQNRVLQQIQTQTNEGKSFEMPENQRKQIAIGTSGISPFKTFQGQRDSSVKQFNKSLNKHDQEILNNSKQKIERQSVNRSTLSHKIPFHHQQNYPHTDQISVSSPKHMTTMSNSHAYPKIIVNQTTEKMFNSMGGIDNQKMFYYTADSQEQVDPQIAADLMRMYAAF